MVFATVYQVVCVLFIIAAVILFFLKNKPGRTGANNAQMGLALFQVVLFGWFFALCGSDVLDIKVNFSFVRVVLDVFYVLAFLAVTAYAFFWKEKRDDWHFKLVLWAFIALIALQCFVYPYGSEKETLRIFEALEGAAVFGLLVAVLLRLGSDSFCKKALIAAVALELLVAVVNVVIPIVSVANAPQAVDILLNYAALFMRPVLFATLALLYQVRLDKKKGTAA